eukprot:16361-Heterococcus_DN1.PRE.1
MAKRAGAQGTAAASDAASTAKSNEGSDIAAVTGHRAGDRFGRCCVACLSWRSVSLVVRAAAYTAATTTTAAAADYLTALSLLHYIFTHSLFSAAESDDISLVVQCAKKIERILKRDFKAEGNGLGELINS